MVNYKNALEGLDGREKTHLAKAIGLGAKSLEGSLFKVAAVEVGDGDGVGGDRGGCGGWAGHDDMSWCESMRV